MVEMENKDNEINKVSINDVENNATPDTHETNDKARKCDSQIDDGNTETTADCGTQVDALIAEIKDINDKYLRTAAELENTRRRAALDAESRARSRAMGVAEKILPLMDAVESALKHNPDDDGIQAIARALDAAFAQIGITKIESVGQILNPMFHNAISVVEKTDDSMAPNTITEEMQSGYMFGDTVMRTAMVIVCK